MLGDKELAACIAAIQAGDSQAMEELYLSYAEAIRRYCYVRLADAEAAQDCVQEIFVNVWRSIKRFEYRGLASFAAWLYAISNNMVINFVRQRQHHPQLSLSDQWQLTDPRDTAGTVADNLAVRQALHRLTPEQQLVVTLRFFAGLSNEEAAMTMKRSVGAVKVLQHRALNRLHQLLADERLGPRQRVPAKAAVLAHA